MQVSKRGLDLIKKYEGFSPIAYLCPANVWTIGYGHTGGVQQGDVITSEDAEELLKLDVAKFGQWVLKLIKVPLNQKEFDALVSFTFNLGAGALQRSTLRMKLNRGEYEEAADEFLKWVRAGGKVMPGLINRRNAERSLFLS